MVGGFVEENTIHKEIAGYDVLFDFYTYEKIKNMAWSKHHSKNDGSKIYFIHIGKDTGYKSVRLHRYILGLKNNDGKIVDHINGNTLDNRLSNLRICTIQQNSQNRKKSFRANTTSLYKGVSFIKESSHSAKGRPWAATIYYDNKNHFLGNFATEEEAHIVYSRKAIEVFGAFAHSYE